MQKIEKIFRGTLLDIALCARGNRLGPSAVAEDLVDKGRAVYRKTWQGLGIFLWIVAEIYNFHCHRMDKGLSPIIVGPYIGVRTALPGNQPVHGYSFGVLIITELFSPCWAQKQQQRQQFLKRYFC